MIDQSNQFYAQRREQFSHLPGDMLLSLARNENGEWRFRKAAVEIMLEKRYAQVNHPELAQLLEEVQFDRAAKEEVIDAVETALEGPIEDHRQGVFDFGHGAQQQDANTTVDYHKAQLAAAHNSLVGTFTLPKAGSYTLTNEDITESEWVVSRPLTLSEPDVKIEVAPLKEEEPVAAGPLKAGFTTENF
jgi:hypothetical protein